MTNRMLWIGIPLLMLALVATGVVYATGRAPKASAGNAQLTSSVMDAPKSCCATQGGSGKSTQNAVLLTNASAKPEAGKAHTECVDGNTSCSLQAGSVAECPYMKKPATKATLASLKGKGADSNSTKGVLSAGRSVVKSDTTASTAVAEAVSATK